MRKLMEIEQEEEKNIERRKVTFRVPMSILNQIDKVIRETKTLIPRNVWMVEALCEKLERDSKDD
jgi:hypothetical protein